MKAVIFLLFAGLLAVQAANFRVVYVPQLVDLDTLGYEDEDNQLWLGEMVNQVGQNIANTANTVTKNVVNTANTVTKNVVNTASTVTHNVANTASTVTHNVVNTANQVGQNIATTTNQIGHNIAVTSNQIGKNVANGVAVTVKYIGQDIQRLKQAFQHGFSEAERIIIRNAKPTVELLIKVGGFSDAEAAWKSVDWKTGRNLDLAIQLTARDCSKLYNRLNKLSGGRLNDLAVDVAEKIAMSAFPPAGILLHAGKVAFKVAGDIHDITVMIHSIEDDVHKGDWAGVAIEGFKLFSLIAQDLK